MALKRKLTKDEFEKLPADLKKEYEEHDTEEDVYILLVEDDESGDDKPNDRLRRALDREKAEAKKLRAKVKEFEEKEKKAGDDQNKRKEKDIETLDREWQEQLAEKEGEFTTKLSAKDKFIEKQLKSGKAMEIASKISTAPALMAKAIAERLSVDFEDDEPRLVVLDKNGKPSEMSLDKLQKEFVANPDYAAIIIASKGSGSATRTTERRSGNAGGSDHSQTLNLATASTDDLLAHMRSVKGD